MEEHPISSVMTIVDSSSSTTELALTHDDDKKNKLVLDDDNNNKKKKKKSVNILKVALMLLRRRSRKSNNVAVDVASKGLWNRLVGSVRSLHLESNQSLGQDVASAAVVVPPHSLPSTEPVAILHASPSVDNFEDVLSSPLSPNHFSQSSASSVDSMSRYASAANLQELDRNEDNDDDENDGETDANMNSGDDMIDAKAEMFIAQFYEQMRLQRSNSYVRYNEMIKRSIE